MSTSTLMPTPESNQMPTQMSARISTHKNNNFGIIKAYAVPHPPIILPEIGQGREYEIEDTIDSLEMVANEIATVAPDTIILTTPHAPLYRDAFFISLAGQQTGDMSAFGFPQIKETLNNDLDLANLIYQKAKGQDILMYPDENGENELDHGSLVPLRFICKKYNKFKLLRLGLSGMDGETHYRLGQLIQEAVNELERKVVFVASGDLSHVLKHDGPYGFRKEGPVFDQKITEILAKAAFDELLRIPEDLIEAAAQCGLPSFQIMAGALDGRDVSAKLLSYQGDFGVGYGVLKFEPKGPNPSRKFLQPKKPQSEDFDSDGINSEIQGNADSSSQTLTQSEKSDPYIDLARLTIEEYIRNGEMPNLTAELPPEMLYEKAATFVTLHRNGKLRGCIGTLEPREKNLADEIQTNAISAAFGDPRFPPLRKDELDSLEVSVDVISSPEIIESMSELDPYRYGVIVSKGFKRGVLLPDLEGVDTAQKQVEIALSKAGIGRSENYQLERFEVVRHEK